MIHELNVIKFLKTLFKSLLSFSSQLHQHLAFYDYFLLIRLLFFLYFYLFYLLLIFLLFYFFDFLLF